MEICDFYMFGSELSSATVQAHAKELDPVPDPTATRFCDHDRLVVGDYGPLQFPIIFEHAYGTKWEDILDTGWGTLYLISDRLRTVLEENHLTGWKTFPIKLLGKKGNEIQGYYGFSVTGRCGPVDYNKCEIIQKRFSELGPIRNCYKGYYIGLEKWDGSDFFIPEETTGTIVTKKTAEVLIKANLTNIYLENLADNETPESTVRMVERKRASRGHS